MDQRGDLSQGSEPKGDRVMTMRRRVTRDRLARRTWVEIIVKGFYGPNVIGPDVYLVPDVDTARRRVISRMHHYGQPVLPLGHQTLIFIARKEVGASVVHVGALEHLREVRVRVIGAFTDTHDSGFIVRIDDPQDPTALFPPDTIPFCGHCAWPILRDDAVYVIPEGETDGLRPPPKTFICKTCRDRMIAFAEQYSAQTWVFHRFGYRSTRFEDL